MWHYYGIWWGFPFFPFVWIVFWIVIISLFWDHGHKRHWRNAGHDEKGAEDILSDRFARGEIDEDEYKKRLQVLRAHAK